MRPHVVIKLREQLPGDAGIPAWLDFIHDKSRARETLTPELDRALAGTGVRYWVTKEYQPAAAAWSAEETQHGLDRTYRVVFQEDCELTVALLELIRHIPGVQDARAIDVGNATLPTAGAREQAIAGARPADLIYLQYAHAVTKGSPEVKIAVLDTGVDLDHAELHGRLVERADFVDLEGLPTSEFIGDFTGFDRDPTDEIGHGTHVSGIIAGRGLRMDEGVAPSCSLMPVRVLATMKDGDRLVGAGIVDNINTGIKWAVDRGAHVINMSLGIRHTGGGLPHADVIRYALAKGVVVVAASGNDGTAERYYPGALEGVVAVGAVGWDGTVTSFTSYGANITCVAPGVQIHSSYAHGAYAVASGTSQASPFVAGAVALMKSYAQEQGVSLGPREVAWILRSTSDRRDTRLRSEHAGYGLINLADAFRLLMHHTRSTK